MAFNDAETTAFFENANQMHLVPATRIQLQTEGIEEVTDLLEFNDDSLKQLVENLRKPGGTIPDPNPMADPGAVIRTPSFVLGAKSYTRLQAAVRIAKYYETVGRDLTPANMMWNPVIKEFTEHWQSLYDRQKEDVPDVPKIDKKLNVMRWSEAFADFLQRVVGVRMIPLSYVTRAQVEVAQPPPPLAPAKPYAEEYESVEGELVARASHDHAKFKDDNAAVYYYLEEAMRGTAYAGSIKPFQRRKNGRGAFLAITAQYAGRDKWEAELKHQDDLLHNRKWKGQSNFSLDKFVAQHRNAYVSMVQCSEHVEYQLPNEYTRVGYLLDAIESKEPDLQAAMALVRNDTVPGGKRNDFEAAAAFLLPHDPVAKKRATAKRPQVEISTVDSTDLKSGIGKTGVELRYHTYAEYTKLSTEQKKELSEWRGKNGTSDGKGKSGKQSAKKTTNSEPSKKKIKKMISEVLSSELATAKKQNDEEAATKQAADDGAYLLSLVHAAAGKTMAQPSVAAATTKPPPITLQSILKNRKQE